MKRGIMTCLVAAVLCPSFAAGQDSTSDPTTIEEALRRIEALQAEVNTLRGSEAQDQRSGQAGDADQTEADEGFWDRMDRVATESRGPGSPWGTIEYQFDTRGFNTLNFTGYSPLPYGFSVWGFVDFQSPDGPNDERFDTGGFFYEIDLKRNLTEQFGLIGEVNDTPGVGNSLGRFGVFYQPKLEVLKENNTWLFFKVFPYETDGEGSQASMAWNTKFPNILDGRFSTGGFVDVNFQSGPSQDDVNVVAECQLRYRLVENLSLLTEVRFNEFLGDGQDLGVGVGLQYRF